MQRARDTERVITLRTFDATRKSALPLQMQNQAHFLPARRPKADFHEVYDCMQACLRAVVENFGLEYGTHRAKR